MQNIIRMVRWSCGLSLLALMAFLLAGCKCENCGDKKTDKAAPAVAAAPAAVAAAASAPAPAPAPVAPPAPVLPTIRINAGATAAYTNSAGEVWLPDMGFEGGDVIDRPAEMTVTNAVDQVIYHTEHYSMTGFSQKLPNGKYTVKLHFAETFEGIGGPGQRVFTVTVEGQEFKDYDVWAKAGGFSTAHVEIIPVEITDGALDIKFTTNVENPEINGIEIIPAGS